MGLAKLSFKVSNSLVEGCPVLCSHLQCIRVPLASHLCQHLSVFWIFAVLVGAQWGLFVFIWNSLMIHNVEHLFVCLFICLI